MEKRVSCHSNPLLVVFEIGPNGHGRRGEGSGKGDEGKSTADDEEEDEQQRRPIERLLTGTLPMGAQERSQIE